MKTRLLCPLAALLLSLSITQTIRAWDYEGHRTVNQLALASLPESFPDFVRTPEAKERIAFLAGEPDRWRNSPDLPLRHHNGPDHYFDMEDLIALKLESSQVSHFRYEFVSQLAVARAANPSAFPAVDAAKDQDKVKVYPGFLPWAITEQYAKLKSGFSYLKVFEELGTPEEISNAKANIIYIMGTMGHFIGDATQPLHTTRHYNGWIGDNPKGYTTKPTFHSWIDGGFLAKAGGLKLEELQKKLRPAKMLWPGDPKAKHDSVFPEAMAFVAEQHKLMEPLYQMDKDGQLASEGAAALPGKPFLEGQIVKAGQMLGDLWYSAWQQATPDVFLKTSLKRRELEQAGNAKSK